MSSALFTGRVGLVDCQCGRAPPMADQTPICKDCVAWCDGGGAAEDDLDLETDFGGNETLTEVEWEVCDQGCTMFPLY